jgi:predicted nucleic acid-binding protein
VYYIDTSAAAKLIIDEPESAPLAGYLDGLAAEETPIASSMLLETELRRIAVRDDFEQAWVSAVLARFDLYESPRSRYHEAGLLPGRRLRTLDALHLALAVRLGAEAILTYDSRQTSAAQSLGLMVIAPF